MLQEEMSIRVSLHTLGCKVNQYETQAIAEKLTEEGFEIVEGDAPSDVHVINTCTVTNLADRKSRQIIRRAVRQDPDAIIVVTGCYAQMKEAEIGQIEGVSIITGTDEKSSIPELIRSRIREKRDGAPEIVSSIRPYGEISEYEDLGVIKGMGTRTRAFVKIQDGCDRFCSYCIIPYARGTVRSRPEDEIVEEVRGLVDSGYKEIVLTGINTALYGSERRENKKPLFSLLEKLDLLTGNFRIRLSSLEPTVVEASDVEWLGKIKRLCHHMHLSIQSGSNRILGLMDRKYDRDDYLRIVRALRSLDEHYGISTDIIVGFPGESREDLKASTDLTREVDFVRIHSFKYSKRDGTKAAAMDDQIPESEKNERSGILTEAGRKSAGRFLEKSVGDVRTVLFEREEKVGQDTYLTGYTDNYIKVYSAPEDAEPDGFAEVRLSSIFEDGMRGTVI